MNSKVIDTLVGGTGLGASFMVDNVNVQDVSQGSGLVSIIVQLAIGIVTLIGLLRKKRV